jgi:general secretion pathway protein G
MSKTRSGFTIVELLVVIVVIAILAAITVVAYNGVQNRAQASALQADLSNAKKKIVLYAVDQGQYPSTLTGLVNSDLTVSKSAYDTTGNNYYYCYSVTSKEFAMSARTAGNKTAYLITSTSGVQPAAGSSANTTCQAIGLPGYTDPNAFSVGGYSTDSGWLSWAKG